MPEDENPHGNERAQFPAKFTEVVKMSSKYIFKGSFVFSPFLYAGVGVTGANNASHSLKTFLKSFVINF